MKSARLLAPLLTSIFVAANPPSAAATFDEDVAFLRQHTKIIVLNDAQGAAQIAVAPAWQGRVMTSTAEHASGRSLGWINREFIGSGQHTPHINVYGGEDRLWLGPEGGQFGLYFAKGVPFDYAHWFVPAALDTRRFRTVNSQSSDRAVFEAAFTVNNHAGTRFHVDLKREVRLLSKETAWRDLGVPPSDAVSLVAYESHNTLRNVGQKPWRKESGLLSIWILGMFPPSPTATIVVPIRPGSESALGPQLISNYFGSIPPRRLQVTNRVIFFRGDGTLRSKIGIRPKRSLGKLGSYDADAHVLTIVQFTYPEGIADYVNSLWKYQDDPYVGEVANSYNDGPPAPGAKPLGPFYEMESSSPAAALAPGASLEHMHRTIHLVGPERELDRVARAVLRVSLAEIKSALQTQSDRK